MPKLSSNELEKVFNQVIESNCLGKSNRKKQIFLYLWEELKKENPTQITQYNIAFDVLKRSDKFDPEIDGIVRADIGRLRSVLNTFSASNDRFSVEIPKGEYKLIVTRKTRKRVFYYKAGIVTISAVIAFSLFWFLGLASSKFQPSPAIPLEVCSASVPTVVVKSDINHIELKDYILTILKKVVSQNTHLKLANKSCSVGDTPEYIIEAKQFSINSHKSILLIARRTGEDDNLISIKYNVLPEGQSLSEDLYFDTIRNLNEIVKPYGVIAKDSLQNKWKSHVARENYACLIKMYDYYSTDSERDYFEVHACLLEASKSDSTFLDLQGALAASYLEQARLYRPKTEQAPLMLAEEILENNDSIISQSVEIIIAKMAYEADHHNFSRDRLDNALLAAEATYNTNPTVLMSASAYSGFKLGDWDRAKRLSDQTKLITKQRDPSIFLVDAALSLLEYTDNIGASECFNLHSNDSTLANLIVKACAIKFEDEYWLDKANTSLNQLGLDTPHKQMKFIHGRNWDRNLVDVIDKLIIPTQSKGD